MISPDIYGGAPLYGKGSKLNCRLKHTWWNFTLWKYLLHSNQPYNPCATAAYHWPSGTLKKIKRERERDELVHGSRLN